MQATWKTQGRPRDPVQQAAAWMSHRCRGTLRRRPFGVGNEMVWGGIEQSPGARTQHDHFAEEADTYPQRFLHMIVARNISPPDV